VIQAEREESEARRKHIAAQNRAANPTRSARVVPSTTRADDLAALFGHTLQDDAGPVNWASLTRA